MDMICMDMVVGRGPNGVGAWQLRTKDRHPMTARQIDAAIACAKALAAPPPGGGQGGHGGAAGVIFLATDRPELRAELKRKHGLTAAERCSPCVPPPVSLPLPAACGPRCLMTVPLTLRTAVCTTAGWSWCGGTRR